jgi:2'-5' RNA ligase
MRLFVAVELENTLKDKVSEIQKKLIQEDADVKWVELKNLHFTLKFIGEVDESRIGDIVKAIDKSLVDTKPCRLSIENIGVFPNESNPKIIWLGVSEGKDEICSLANIVQDKLAKIGFAREKRKFSPHLTLGRVKSARNKGKLLDAVKSMQGVIAGVMDVREVLLMQSRLTPKGAIYSRVHKFKLCG